MQLLSLLNPFSWFVTLREKLLALAAFTMLMLGMGWHLHTVWDAYIDSGNTHRQLERAQEVPAKLSKFHQQLRASHVEETPCWSAQIPSDVLKLIK